MRGERKRTKKRNRRAATEVFAAGETVGRRIVFIRDNRFVKPRRSRRAAG